MNDMDKVSRKRNVIIKVAKVEFCYNEFKFVRKETTDDLCPFGLKKFTPEKCMHCRYIGEQILNTSEEK